MQTKKMRTGKCWFEKGDFDHFGSGGGGGGSSHQETPRFRMQEKLLVSGEKYTTSRLHIDPTSPQILSGVGTAPSKNPTRATLTHPRALIFDFSDVLGSFWTRGRI